MMIIKFIGSIANQ